MGCDFSDGPEIRRRRAFVKKLCEVAGHPLTRALTLFGQPFMMQIIDTVHAAVNDDGPDWGWSRKVTSDVLIAVAADSVKELKKNRTSYKKRTEPSTNYKTHRKSRKTLRAIGSSSSGATTTTAAAAATSTASTAAANTTHSPNLSATTPINPPVSPISGETALSSKTFGASGQPQRTPLGHANNCNGSSA